MRSWKTTTLILSVLALVLSACGGDNGGPTPTPTADVGGPEDTPTPVPSTAPAVFDANLLFTSGVFVPVQQYTSAGVAPLTTAAWTSAARPITRVAADGASLLILRATLAMADASPVTFSLQAGGMQSGGLFAIDDQNLVDSSSDGGTIDGEDPGPTQLVVDTVVVGNQRYAFALYRSPRDFDVPGGSTNDLREYAIEVNLSQSNGSASEQITIVRPPVVFVHGTFDDNSAWLDFNLWKDSANEINNYAPTATLPFDADRISYQWIHLSGGHMSDNAATIVPQLTRSLQNWREVASAAGTQADVVTHSFGGPVTRQAIQTQPDSNPVTPNDQANFRAATNWGHGTIHKLITLSGSHRGSPVANLVSLVNANGLNGTSSPGLLRSILCLDAIDVGAGALGDQLVLSPAMEGLDETPVPAHAFAGSGIVPNEAPGLAASAMPTTFGLGSYHGEYWSYQCLAAPDGPYGQAGAVSQTDCINLLLGSGPESPFDNCAYNRLTNYTFNLSYDVPPLKPMSEDSNCTPVHGPNYDLTVSDLSAQGMLPAAAFTSAAELNPALVGHLNHTEMRSNPMVSAAVTALLHAPAASPSFARFPATGSPTALEQELANVGSPAGLTLGEACSAPPIVGPTNCYLPCSETPGNIPCFKELKVHPSPLVIRGFGIPAPIFIYALYFDPNGGPLDGKWVNVQSVGTGFWCTVTMTSSNDAVASIQTGQPADQPVVVGVSTGQATVTVTVETRVIVDPVATFDVPVTIEPLLTMP
jgi:pimeloyl-ACP methyl ester carboxylesterase